MNRSILNFAITSLLSLLILGGCSKEEPSTSAQPETSVAVNLTDEQIENIVRRSYQYVAMYNVNNKFAMDPANPTNTGGWNRLVVNTQLLDHSVKAIPRPNNDTLYIIAMLDLRKDPVIIDVPFIDTKYVSLMVTGYDHYVNVPMSVTMGDFKEPEKVLFYTERTENFDDETVKSVDRNFKMNGDFVSAIFRVMPHANDNARFDRIVEQMKKVKLMTLSEFKGKPARPIDDVDFPAFGKTDADIFENNFLEVMQFVFNYTSFEKDDELDQALLTAMKSLGVEQGNSFDKDKVATIDDKRFRRIAGKVQREEFARSQDPAVLKKYGTQLFQPKGKMPLHLLVTQSVTGPIGLPVTEAVYPSIATDDGQPMNARYDYVIRMSKAQLPPAKAFWSLTLYDSANGFFIPNQRKKYSVGENAGMKLNEQGGLDIYIAAKNPPGVPAENWLPINRKDENIDIVLRVYAPDIDKFTIWQAPNAVRL